MTRIPRPSPAVGCKRWFVALLACCALVSFRAALSAAASDALFAPDRLLDVRIEIAPEDWEKLRQERHDLLAALGPTRFDHPEPKPYKKYPASVTIDGVPVGSVGLRKRGFLGSSSFRRPSLGIYFDEYDRTNTFAGLRKMSLNNNLQDPSLVHQTLAYRVFAQAGVPAPRCNFARVTVNGDYLGVYSHVEAIEDEFLERHFGSAAGNLYEGQLSDFRPQWVKTFERKNHKKDKDRSELEAMVQALEAPDAELLDRLAPLLDIDAFLTFWAVEVLIGHWDSYSNNGNNFFVYRDPATRKFRFIPWGTDSLLGHPDPFTPVKTPESVKAITILPRRLYHLPDTRERYRTRMRELLEAHWREEELLAEVDRLETFLKPYLHLEPDVFEKELGRVRQFIRNRRSALEPELAGPAPEWKLPLRRSACLRKIGRMAGTFDTVWRGLPASNEVVHSSADFSVKIKGRARSFSATGVTAGPSYDPRLPDCSAIAFIGVQLLRTRVTVPVLVIQPEFYRPHTTMKIDGIAVAGVMLEGQVINVNPKAPRLFLGTLELQEAGKARGERVRGKVNADIFELPL